VNGKIFMDYFLEKDVYFGIGGKSIKVWSLVHNNWVKIFKLKPRCCVLSAPVITNRRIRRCLVRDICISPRTPGLKWIEISRRPVAGKSWWLIAFPPLDAGEMTWILSLIRGLYGAWHPGRSVTRILS
jgi:hypothetical protein